MRLRLVVGFALVLTGAKVAFAQQGDVGGYGGGSTDAARSLPVPPPTPTPQLRPCSFGPITRRVALDDVEAIIQASPTRRAAWYAILALEEDEEVAPLNFAVTSEDDGLGDGLVCPAPVESWSETSARICGGLHQVMVCAHDEISDLETQFLRRMIRRYGIDGLEQQRLGIKWVEGMQQQLEISNFYGACRSPDTMPESWKSDYETVRKRALTECAYSEDAN